MSSTSFLSTSDGALTDVAWLLITCLGLTSIFALIQLLRITNASAPPGSFRKGTCLYPWTVQKQIHATLFFSVAARICFLVVANYAWDSSTGTLIEGINDYLRIAFYVLDELPVIILFSTGLHLALFWSELYYQGEDGMDIYHSLVKPVIDKFHGAAYIGLLLIYIGYATIWQSFDYYIINLAAYYLIGLYIITGILLIWYARLSGMGFLQVPIEVQIRRRKYREIWTTTLAMIVTYIARIILLGLAAGEQALVWTSWGQWIGIFCYYWLLENAPALVILHYFHRMPSTSFLHRFHYFISSDAVAEEEAEAVAALASDDHEAGGGGVVPSSDCSSLQDRLALIRLLHEEEKRRIGSTSKGGAIQKAFVGKVTTGMIEHSIRRLSLGSADIASS